MVIKKKILSDQIKYQIEEYKKLNKKIVFTNGCFDLLHKGHKFSLDFASNQGDCLVVGLNSDKSIKRLKGKSRPIQNQKIRFKNLKNLKNVDLVIIFDDDTPENLIKEIKPNILIKGKDYEKKDVVGKNYVESYGGKLVFSPILSGFSTTNIVKNESKKKIKQLD